MENRVWSAGEAPTSSSIQINAQGMNIAKLFECPVCLEVMTPPITLCTGGHAICNECRKAVKICPTCRGQFTDMRNRFAENFLDNCLVRCKYHEGGCQAIVPGGDLAKHYKDCDFRPITCPWCIKEIPYDKFLEHFQNVEKVVVQRMQECSSRFKFKREDNSMKKKCPPVWIRAYDRDFFCFLEKTASKCKFCNFWILWVGFFGTVEECQNYVGSFTIFNKEQNTEMKYVGKIHPIRMPKQDIMDGGHCLLLMDAQIKKFVNKKDGIGIDVIFRIDKKLINAPQSRPGTPTPSPNTPSPGRSNPIPGPNTPTPGPNTPSPAPNTPTTGRSNPTPGRSNPTPSPNTPTPGRSNPIPGPTQATRRIMTLDEAGRVRDIINASCEIGARANEFVTVFTNAINNSRPPTATRTATATIDCQYVFKM